MATDVQTCYRHADRRAGVRCQRCDRPICPGCMRQASVGFHCPDCTRSGSQRVVPARAAVSQRVLVTTVLVAANLAVWGTDLLSAGRADGIFDGIGDLGRDWALHGPTVAAGDWWRPITSGFVHSGVIHVGFNMFLLWQLGRLLEPALRWYGFLAVYALSLCGGSLLVLVLDPEAVTVGASGAVFGLMGAAFVAMRSQGVDPFATGLGPLLVINLLFTFTVPGISIGGHVGGLVAGAAGGLVLWEWGGRLTGAARLVPVAACALAAAGLYGACLAIA